MTYVLTISCADTVGIVASVSGFLAGQGGFITESAHFGDEASNRFFMRTVFRSAAEGFPILAELRESFAPLAASFAMDWAIDDAAQKPRVLIAVSKFGHCLHDLLYRWSAGSLPIDIIGVVSNHGDMRKLVEGHGLTYHHLPVPNEAAFLQLAAGADLVVLARYMQILPDTLASALAGRCINIHHSFLPSFKGARPYHQAFARGVKIIGATAHYVTADLDEGPIIEQEVARVDHTASPEKMVAVGRDIEAIVLARAVQWHAEKRVLLNGDKTVVFR